MTHDDKYTYPGSGGVLRNKLGITDPVELDEAMNDYASAAWAVLSTSIPKVFDFAYLQRVHQEMFEPLFDWAGRVRDVNTAAGDTGIVYARPKFLKPALEDMFSSLERDEYLLGTDDEDKFAAKLAVHWGYLTQIHPFRDGNTRSQSLFISNLAEAAGHPVDWRLIDVNALRDARLRAVQGSETALAELLQRAVAGQAAGLAQSPPVFSVDFSDSAGVAATTPSGRCGKPLLRGGGFCLRRVGDDGCPYHG